MSFKYDKEWLRAEIKEQIRQSNIELYNTIKADIKQMISDALSSKKNNELVVSEQIADNAANKVMVELKSTVLPQINNIIQWVGYQVQDGAELVDEYRRDINQSSNNLIEYQRDPRVIGPYVRTMY